jgi:uncharacterized damage-inducible protein DinB
MTPAEREKVISYLNQSRQNLLNTADKLSPTQLQFKPAPDRWSVAGCVEHIIVVENRIFDLITVALQQPGDGSKRSAFEGRDEALVERVVNRAERVQAPEAIHPVGRWPQDHLLSEFEFARTRSLDFAAKTGAELRRHFAPHPRLGEFDCYQWLLMIGAHGERHRAQAEEVIASADFPRAAAAL